MSDTAIAAAPIVVALSPLVNAAASGLVIGLGGLLFALLARVTGIAYAPDAQARLEKAADAEVHALIAGAENNLATGKFSVGNPLVATAATAVIANAPAIVAKLGLNEAAPKCAGVRRDTPNPLFYLGTVSDRPRLYVAVRPHILDEHWSDEQCPATSATRRSRAKPLG